MDRHREGQDQLQRAVTFDEVDLTPRLRPPGRCKAMPCVEAPLGLRGGKEAGVASNVVK